MTYSNITLSSVTEFDHLFRILFIGDDSVGKTSLIDLT
jgi:GTPase SAR1 family protein